MNRRGMILMVLAMAVGTLAYDAKAAWIKRWLPEESFPWPQGKTLYFRAEFGGLFWPYLWHEAQLYVNGVLKESQPLGGTAGYTWLPWKFDTLGTVEIKVRARYDSVPFGVDVWTDYVTWTVEVYAHPPSASRVSPDSPVTVSEGDTQAFTARATDIIGNYSIERVDWYLDGEHQADFTFDPFVPREHTWSHTFDTPGEYTVEAVFTDSHGYPSGVIAGEAVWTVNVIAKRTLTISSTPGGSVTSPGEGVFECAEGTEVTLEATPDGGYHFTHWSGSVSSTSNPLQLTMENDYDVTANFAADTATYTLTISSSAGGSVTSPGEGAFDYGDGTEVMLEATPDDGYHFTHWSGSLSSTSNPLHLTMENDYNVTANFALAATALYVDDDAPADPGPGDPGVSDPQEDGTAQHPFDRIQEGIDAATEGGSVIVLAGTYPESIDLRGLAIRLCSAAGPQQTIIDGAGALHVVQCVSGEGPDTVIEGFTITGGNASAPPSDDWGGGMYNVASSPTVTNCIFTGNMATLGGAGMGNISSAPVVTNCLFTDNTTGAGGMGAGILNCDACRAVLTNCTFAGNVATSGNALACASDGQGGPSRVLITNCILWDGGDEIRAGNSVVTVTYSDVQSGWPGEGNLMADPVFVGPSQGNLRLWTGSPCIDAGAGTSGPPPAWQPSGGMLGGALELDGVDNCVVSHAVGGHINGAQALTVALWVKSDVTNTDRGFICFGDPDGTDDRQMRYAAQGQSGQGVNVIRLGVTASQRGGSQSVGHLESSGNVQTTAWQHVAMTWASGEAVKLYINGTLETPSYNDPAVAGALRGYTKLLIGRGGAYGETTGWDGRIDDVAVFSRALDAAEIVRLRDSGGASFLGDAGLEGLWQFDESAGPLAHDSSGAGNDAWLACLPATDLDGAPRVADGNEDGADVVDMGAYESRQARPRPGGR